MRTLPLTIHQKWALPTFQKTTFLYVLLFVVLTNSIGTSLVWNDSSAFGTFESASSWIPATAPTSQTVAAYFNSSNPPPVGSVYSTTVTSSITTGHVEASQSTLFKTDVTILPNFSYSVVLGNSFVWTISSDSYDGITCQNIISRPMLTGVIGTPGNINCWVSFYGNSTFQMNSSSTLQGTSGIFSSHNSDVSIESASINVPEILNWGLGVVSISNSTILANTNPLQLSSRGLLSNSAYISFSAESTLENDVLLSTYDSGYISFVDASFSGVSSGSDKTFHSQRPIDSLTSRTTSIIVDNSTVPIIGSDESPVSVIALSSSTLFSNVSGSSSGVSEIFLSAQNISASSTLTYSDYNWVKTLCSSNLNSNFSLIGTSGTTLKFSKVGTTSLFLSQTTTFSGTSSVSFSDTDVLIQPCDKSMSITPMIISSLSLVSSRLDLSTQFHPFAAACTSLTLGTSQILASAATTDNEYVSLLVSTDSDTVWTSGSIQNTLLSVGQSQPSRWSPQSFVVPDLCPTSNLGGSFTIVFGPTFNGSSNQNNGNTINSVPTCRFLDIFNPTDNPKKNIPNLASPAVLNTPFLSLSSSITPIPSSSYYPSNLDDLNLSYKRNSTCFVLDTNIGTGIPDGSTLIDISIGATDLNSPGTVINIDPYFNAELIVNSLMSASTNVHLNFLSNITVQPKTGTETLGVIPSCPKTVIFSDSMKIHISPLFSNSSASIPFVTIANTTMLAIHSDIFFAAHIDMLGGHLAIMGDSQSILNSDIDAYFIDSSLSLHADSILFISDFASLSIHPMIWNSSSTNVAGKISVSAAGVLKVQNSGPKVFGGVITVNKIQVSTTIPPELSCQCNYTSCSLDLTPIPSVDMTPLVQFIGISWDTPMLLSLTDSLIVQGSGSVFDITNTNVSSPLMTVSNEGALKISESNVASTINVNSKSTFFVHSPIHSSTANIVNFDSDGIYSLTINDPDQPIPLVSNTIVVTGGILKVQVVIPIESITAGFDPTLNPVNYTVLSWSSAPSITGIDVSFPGITNVLTDNFCQIDGHSHFDSSGSQILVWFSASSKGCNQIVDGNDDQQFNDILNFNSQPFTNDGIGAAIGILLGGCLAFGAIYVYRSHRAQLALAAQVQSSTADANDLALLLSFANDD